MKAYLLIPVLFLAACRPNPSEKTSAPQAENTTEATDASTTTSSLSAEGMRGKDIFESNCTSCHSIHEKLIGPALKGVGERHPEEWLLKFIRNSQKMIKEGDPLAVKLYEENNKIAMNSFEHLSDDDIRNILTYLNEVEPEETKVMP